MEPITALTTITILAAFGEAVIEVLKPLLEPLVGSLRSERVEPYQYLSAVLGVGLAAVYQANVLQAIGLPGETLAAHWAGVIGTGLILGRGSNFVHNVISNLGDDDEDEDEDEDDGWTQ